MVSQWAGPGGSHAEHGSIGVANPLVGRFHHNDRRDVRWMVRHHHKRDGLATVEVHHGIGEGVLDGHGVGRGVDQGVAAATNGRAIGGTGVEGEERELVSIGVRVIGQQGGDGDEKGAADVGDGIGADHRLGVQGAADRAQEQGPEGVEVSLALANDGAGLVDAVISLPIKLQGAVYAQAARHEVIQFEPAVIRVVGAAIRQAGGRIGVAATIEAACHESIAMMVLEHV